jgi:Peptidase A4 family
MNKTTLIISALVLSLPGIGFCQSNPAPGTNSPLAPTPVRFSTNLPEATTTAGPSAGNPLTMSASDLAAWGFPPQPDPVAAPQAYAVWVQAMTAAQTRIFPGLWRLPRAHGPTAAAPGVDVSNSTPVVASAVGSSLGSYNWSGYLNTNLNTSGAAFTTVFAQYVIPRAQQAPGACTGGWTYSSTWVGLDGAGGASSDVLQAGTNSDAYCAQSSTSTNPPIAYGNYSPWYEWYPNNATLVWGLPTHAGDIMFVEVWSTSPTTGNVFMVDYNTQQYVSISLAPPAGVQLAGASAEWITELPTVSGNLGATLTNYVSEYMSGVFALDSNGALYDPSVSTPIVMVDSNTQPISYPTLLGTGAALLQSTGSVQ